MTTEPVFDVLVIGAGLSGLTAAKALVKGGLKVCIAEARSRIGGRICSQTLEDGCVIELGATWIGPTQDLMYSLCQEYSIPTFPQPMEGKTVQLLRQIRGEFKGIIPPLPIISLLDLELNIRITEHIAKKISLESPWNSDMAEYYDSITIQQLIDNMGYTEDFKVTFISAIRIIFGKEPNEVSALNWLWLIKSCTSCMHLFDTEGGAQQDRILGGTSRIPDALYQEIRREGGVFYFDCPILKIDSSQGEHIRLYSKSSVFKAKKVVIAIPPVLASRIEFLPVLDGTIDALLSRYTTGCLTKILVRYSTRWWNEKGLNGTFITDQGPITYMADHCSVVDGKEFIGLLGFVCGKFTIEYRALDAATRKEKVLNQLCKVYQSKEAMNALEFHETDWANDEWSRGCPVGSFGTGVLTGGYAEKNEFLRYPLDDKIYFAGTEFALIWSGYMEGAVRSGLAAANSILNGTRPQTQKPNPQRFKKPSNYKTYLFTLLVLLFSFMYFT